MSPSIADYALLSDARGAALVSTSGSIDWACLERFDAPSTFARLLDPDAGHWWLGPSADDAVTERRYVPGTMVTRTEHRVDGPEGAGVVAVTDALVFRPEERGHGIGQQAPDAVVRLVEGIEGQVELVCQVAPRGEYGLATPLWERCPGGVRSRGGARGLLLSVPDGVDVEIDGGDVLARFGVTAGTRLGFALRSVDPFDGWPSTWSTDQVRAWLYGTVKGWQSWSEMHQSYEGPYAEQVHHSGRVLQALTYAPSGSVVAAATTSLPEVFGGSANWDYRYVWVRDASLTLNALWVAACPDEVEHYFRFFVSAAGGGAEDRPLQIVYGPGGEQRLPEIELGHLAGHRDSRPVRIGNDAWRQEQLDVYGELLDAASVFVDIVGEFEPAVARFLVRMADLAAAKWDEPDHGIWEDRGEPLHYTYSKLMCWVALERAVDMAQALGASDRVDEWSGTRDRIADAILSRGWNDALGAFTQTFDGDVVDASVLMIPIVGFLSGDDGRVRSTMDVIDQRLSSADGLVWRNEADRDQGQGAFLIATFWMAHALAVAGDVEAARRRFERAAACANDVGLLAEEVDVTTGELMGNYPQAFSHIGLVNAAWAIATAERSDG